MGAACSCGDARAMSAVIANGMPGRPDGAEAVDDVEEEPPQVDDGLMDDDGAFHGPDGVPVEVSLGEFLLGNLRRHASYQRVAQVDATSGEVWTFQTLLAESVQVATVLTADGFVAGDVIAFFSKNYNELYGALIGCVLAGITAATMVPTHGAAELRQQLMLCKPKAIFVEADLLPRTEEALDDFPSQVKIFTLQPVADAGHVTSYQTLSAMGLEADPDTYSSAEIPDRHTHPAFILYSSGTTGMPKGVMIPNHGLTSMVQNLSGVPDVQPSGVVSVLVLAPISWISGVTLILRSIQTGMRRVAIPSPNPRSLLTTIQKYKVNLWPTAPTILLSLVQHPAIRLLSFDSVKLIMSAGGPLSAELQNEVAHKVNCVVVQGYGSTEAGILLSTSLEQNKPGSMGVAQPMVSLRVVDLETNEVVRTPGHVGELRIRGPCAMIGYIGNPEATAECYDEEGWFKSGDLVTFDSGGYFFYVDRLKEMIKYKGNQVAPTQVEAVLVNHPGVKDACVMGVQNLLDGEHPMAFIVKNKKKVRAKDLQDYVAERLSDPKHLRGGIIFLDAIPRTVTGKTMRIQLKQMLASMEREGAEA